MIRVLHLIEGLSFGGAARGVFAAAKFSSKSGRYEHAMMPISMAKSDLGVRELAAESGVRLILPKNRDEMIAEIEAADIVQLNWWNSPDVDAFLRSSLPAMRLAGWLHVGGHVAPQVVVPELLDYLDVVIPTSPHAMNAPAIASLKIEEQRNKVVLAYGPADFSRLTELSPKPHTGFNIGYIGTISFVKMHPNFVKMSAPIDIPDVKFVVCGSGGAEQKIIDQANELGVADRFDVRGYVQDIRPVLETMDAYGYPLCEDTYASSELNLQEVMYAGIPPVVFPSGGVKHLVINGVTGYIVHSAVEYKEALEHLYRHPETRRQLGDAARQYALRLFGAENAALKLNAVYERMMTTQKRVRRWNVDIAPGPSSGAEAFARSLGRTTQGDAFWESIKGTKMQRLIAADKIISRSSDLLASGGIHSYRGYYPDDPFFWFWSGLINLARAEYPRAAGQLLHSAQKGFEHWRVLWYLAIAAEKAGEYRLAGDCSRAVEQAMPGFISQNSF